ncbi:DUF4394 domain-containing protein [Sphingomonas naphthae]|uniref:DUF4394 domain-containing protein n=1 Tax=Sphingomonas naphthae TaxID=1813468 RepID=A0ABY7TMK8_9SPHN|nr:DUF4394 domain-containing protein [Sphingomonas naphthae]WCT74452.1 DUF4394 domain-containing protein [Sphingomonas naphthae]
MRVTYFRPLVLASTTALALGMAGGASAQTLQTVGAGNTLVSIGATAPGTVTRSVAITGVAAGTTIGGIDYRPASPRVLYGVSNVGQLYAINSRTGAATAVGTPAIPTISSIALDFNPTVDRIRLITQVGQDVRINPDNGALAAIDGPIAYATTDASAGQIATVAGAAYTNSVAGATTTTLYVIDNRGGLAPARLATQGNATVSPNNGTLFTVGSTGVASTGSVGFDISREGAAYATLTNPTTGVTSLYSINLTTGAATLIGALSGNTTYNGLAVQLASFASMGTTPNQAAVGGVLDGFVGLPSGNTLALFNAIDGTFATPGAQSAALLALSPAAYSNLPDISLNAVESQETTIGRVTRAGRTGAAMGDGSRAALDADGKANLWISGGSRYGRYKAAIDRYGADTDEYHFIGGADYQIMPTVAVGAFGGYSSTNAHLGPNASRGRLENGFGGLYATASVGPAYVTGWGSYNDLTWAVTRNVAIGAFRDSNSARTKGTVYAGGGTLGLAYDFGGFELEPTASVRYAYTKIDGFIELGGVSALTISRARDESLRSNLALRAAKSFEIMGATVKPSVHGGWYHEFQNRQHLISASFLNTATPTPFTFTTTALRRNYYNAGGSLDIGGGGPISFFAGYDVQFDKDREFYNMTLGMKLAL